MRRRIKVFQPKSSVKHDARHIDYRCGPDPTNYALDAIVRVWVLVAGVAVIVVLAAWCLPG